MQTYTKTCHIIDDFFQSKTSIVIKSYLTPVYWVSTMYEISCGDPTDKFDNCLGIFSTEKRAVQETLRYWIQRKYIGDTPTLLKQYLLKYSMNYKMFNGKLDILQIQTKNDLEMVREEFGDSWKRKRWRHKLTTKEIDVCFF